MDYKKSINLFEMEKKLATCLFIEHLFFLQIC